MPAKIVLSLLVLALVGGGVALAATGNVALIVVGVLLVAVGTLFGKVAAGLLRNPQAAAERLLARRAELESRAGRPATEGQQPPAAGAEAIERGGQHIAGGQPLATLDAVVPAAAPVNRAARRAAERAGKSKGRPSAAPRR